MLAIGLMSGTAQAIFFSIAVILFVLSGIGFKPAGDRVHLVGLGLAFFVFVYAWNQWAVT